MPGMQDKNGIWIFVNSRRVVCVRFNRTISTRGKSAVANRQGRLEKIVQKDNVGNVTKEHEKIVIRQFSNAERLQKIFY